MMRRAQVLVLVIGLAGCGDDENGPGSAAATGAGGATTTAGAGGGTATGGSPGAGGGGAGGATGSGGGAGGEGGEGGEGGGGGGGEAGSIEGPALYPGGRTHSPLTAHVAQRLRDIAAGAPSAQADVFMKVGASSTVSSNTLFCFDGGTVDLGAHQALAPTLTFFLGGDAAGTSPFARVSEAAEVGRGAGWAIAGDPSPLAVELAAVAPSIALVHYGTNDMGGGATYESALVAFHANMSVLLGTLEGAGVVPVVFGITRRGDDAEANRWVGTFNAALRGMAQRAQVPFVDLHHAIDPLAGNGLGGDGLHLEAYAGGACVLDQAGLEHGYNVRNLVALEALDRVMGALVPGAEGVDEPGSALQGDGSSAAPFFVPSFPFAHDASTLEGAREVDVYPACSATDESGPELWYRLELDAPARIRAVVLDRDGVDVDLHLVGAAVSGDGCVARGHHTIEVSLPAGVHHLAVDTFVSGGVEQGGDFLLVVVACDEDDAACGG